MVYTNTYNYFIALISVASAMLPENKSEDKLTDKEIKFLALCCEYAHNGNDLSRFIPLSKHIIKKGFCTTARHVSYYKTKLGSKRWIVSGVDVFEISALFKCDGTPKIFTLQLAADE
jgi:hypothetical protein